jgi:hypothetical protein
MKHGVIYFSSAFLLALCAAPLSAWADAKPDFDDDAKPILQMQPGLLQYVESRFEVKDTGIAKYPGDDDRPPGPPYIFRARRLGSSGSYNFRLLIQPGEPGHILGVVDMNKVHVTTPAHSSSEPAVVSRAPAESQPSQSSPAAPVQVPELSAPPVEQQPSQAPAQQPAAPSQPSAPTSDTPSGPIPDSGNPSPSSSNLAPPPDPAPPTQ